MTGRFGRRRRIEGGGEPQIPGFLNFELIGSGGFSKVYTAYQERFARTVAVKVVTVDLSPEASRRFEREQQTAGQLDGHPNVIRIYESGRTEGGRPYLVMEHHAEGSLTDRLRRHGPLPVADVLDIGIKLAGALGAAHRRGIVHRDVKPQNVLVSPFVGPVLADFGIAALDPGRFTVTTEAFSVNHAAPEVLAGHPATASADLYSLASMLYELLSGRPPFADDERPELLALIRRVQQDPVPPIGRPDLPPDAESAILGLLARDPAQRPVDGAAFADRLRNVQRSLGLAVTAADPMAGPAERGPAAAVDADVWRPPTAGSEPSPGEEPAVAPPYAPPPVDDPGPHHQAPSWVPPARPGNGSEAGDGAVGGDLVAPAAPGPLADATIIPPAGFRGGAETAAAGPPPPPAAPGTEGAGDGTVIRSRVPEAAAPPLDLGDQDRRQRRWIWFAAAAVVVFLLGLGFAVVRGQSDEQADPVPSTTTAPFNALGPCPNDLKERYEKQADGLNESFGGDAPPTDVAARAKPTDPSVAEVTWKDANQGTAVYTVLLRCGDGSQFEAVSAVAPGKPLKVEITGLDESSNYCFAVLALPPEGQESETPELGTTADGSTQACLDG